MNVSQLITQLKEADPNAKVFICTDYNKFNSYSLGFIEEIASSSYCEKGVYLTSEE